jgi:hypothetical protein
MTTEKGHSVCPPILFLIFNRPDTTARVFEAIQLARPARLYLAADGARKDRVSEQEVVNEVRRIVMQVNWPCQVFKLYRDSNLGCKRAVSSAIDWFFEHEEEGVILEDDCLPHIDFFLYCAQLLERYRDDERIGFIAGTALCDLRASGLTWGAEDYVFTRYPSVWGWATWRRVWKDYDVSISGWPERRRDITALTHNSRLTCINTALFDRVFAGGIDTWDYQVSYMLWTTSRLAIVPRVNLIENIGFGPQATHTTNSNNPLAIMAKMHAERLTYPLRSPFRLLPNRAYQEYVENFATRSLFSKILGRLGFNVS